MCTAARASSSGTGATHEIVDEAGVVEKFGVPPASIPDYLALVGDSSDGYPGTPRLGREVVCSRARAVRPPRGDPEDPSEWHVNAANSGTLARTLVANRPLVHAVPGSRDAAHRSAARSIRWTR